jgi:hypothetical protein
MVNKILETMRAKKWEEAKWLAETTLLSNGVSKVTQSSGSTSYQVPLSAADLPTLLDMLLEIQTPTGPLGDATSRSSLSKAAEYLRKFSGTGSDSGPAPEHPAPSSTPSSKRLPSNRKYWPAAAKDEFWSLVRQLNKYDKENMEGGQKSPLQLSISEQIIRQCWEPSDGSPSQSDRSLVAQLADVLYTGTAVEFAQGPDHRARTV